MTKAQDIIDKAEKRAKRAKDHWAEIYQKAKDDLYFLSDAPHAQWDQKEASSRVSIGRPALQIDQLTQFVHQVSNDIRMNTPTIKVIPDGMDSDPETAEIIQGRIKAIEYKSNADAAYDMAADFSVKSSIGFIRVDRGYVNDTSFDQELKICRVTNPLAILIDPDSTEPDGSDAKWGFVWDSISRKDFEEKYPDAAPISFGDENYNKDSNSQDDIEIAEYFTIVEEVEEIGLLDDGTVVPYEKQGQYKSRRKITKRKVMHYTLAGQDILEETIFPGKYIPIVPVYGEEAWEEGKRKLHSLIRKSKSAQAMYNLWKSLETELLLKQQQAPVQAAVGQMSGFEQDWKQPDKAMVLYYHQKDAEGNPAPAPQRLQPPTIPTGVVNAARETVDDIKATMGMYNASIGIKSNETSGVAIQSRQKEGDVATFHFGDNLVRSITQVGKIIVAALPDVEDTPRVVQTIGLEDEIKPIGINGQLVEGQERTYDFTKGRFDVRVITGPSFTTQRQEAAANYNQIISAMPDLMPIIGDLVFKYQDVPGSQAISARLKKLVDPKLLDESEREKDGVDPKIQALQAEFQQVVQQAQLQIQALQTELQKKNVEEQKLFLEGRKLDIEEQKVEIEYYNAQKEVVAPPTYTPTVQQPEPTVIKLDTSSLNLVKSKEELEMESSQQLMKEQREVDQFNKQLMLQQQQEQQEREDRMMQTQIFVEALGNISQQLNTLAQTVSQPITVERDEAGNIVGAK